jgi:GPR1/FUN34/yaaH family
MVRRGLAMGIEMPSKLRIGTRRMEERTMSVHNPATAGPASREAARSPEVVESRPGGIVIADPGPLGLAAFAMTTFLLSMFNADLVSRSGEAVRLGLAPAYGGIAQVLAGMWEFRTANTSERSRSRRTARSGSPSGRSTSLRVEYPGR